MEGCHRFGQKKSIKQKRFLNYIYARVCLTGIIFISSVKVEYGEIMLYNEFCKIMAFLKNGGLSAVQLWIRS